MDDFGNSVESKGNNFFYYFNYQGALISLPAGSFDTSNITTVGNHFFSYFNREGALTSLPAGSFDTSNITAIGTHFFYYFNYAGKLSSLPAGSFDTSNITTVGNYFFYYFNYGGELSSLPAGSFDISNITTVGSYFFSYFNYGGALSSLPAGSFDTSNITTVGTYFFAYFNRDGALSSLPDGSFDTSNITTVGTYFFAYFNGGGVLSSLPDGSFDISNISTTVGDNFFAYFNYQGALISLPAGSFDTSNITTVGTNFFNNFNREGALTSLPVGSFDISNITTVGIYFFANFNYNGKLTSLPEGSFDTSEITTAGTYFFSSFNYNGKLTSLPAGSFDTSKITTAGNNFFYSFNYAGKLSSLPAGSFDTSNITAVGTYFFASFNYGGALISLPAGSFDTSNITTVGTYFFASFNQAGALSSLPDGSFISTLSQTEINKSNVFYRTFYNSLNLEFDASTMTPYVTITPSSAKETFSGSKVYVRDDAGWSTTQIANWGVKVRSTDTTPPTATFTPNGSGTYAKSHTTTVNVTDTNLKTDSLKYQRTTSSSAPTEASFSSTFTNNSFLTKSDGNGPFYLRILAKDTAGNTLITGSNGFNIDNTAPSGTISINAGASYTATTAVTLTLSASDTGGVTQMCISNTTTCSSREPYATTKSRILTTGEGTKTVYAQFRDSAGNTSTQTTDTIIVDSINPTATFTPNGSGTYAKSHTTTVNVTDTNLKTDSLKFQRTTSSSAPTEASFSSTFTNNSFLTKSDGNGTFYLRILAKDTAGNTLITGSNGFNIDNTAPTCTSEGDSTTRTGGNRTITYGCSDANGCNPSYSGGSQTFSTTTTTATIPSYEIRDTAGNTTTCPSRIADVYVDKTAPTCGTRSYVPTISTSGNVVATLTGSTDGES
ncbi:MAG: BspA family leucine-rich repeat surface protein [Candidatus Peribacteria bacterium]|nr:BspA family leucine-rich repeat surface protein [Candidatus Peribacteria bacterium]